MIHVCGCGQAYTTVHLWRSEDNFQGSALSSHQGLWGLNSGYQACEASSLTHWAILPALYFRSLCLHMCVCIHLYQHNFLTPWKQFSESLNYYFPTDKTGKPFVVNFTKGNQTSILQISSSLLIEYRLISAIWNDLFKQLKWNNSLWRFVLLLLRHWGLCMLQALRLWSVPCFYFTFWEKVLTELLILVLDLHCSPGRTWTCDPPTLASKKLGL